MTTLNNLWGWRPSTAFWLRAAITAGDLEGAKREASHQDTPWTLPVYSYVDSGDLAGAKAYLEKVLDDFEVVMTGCPCQNCQDRQPPILFAFDSSGLLDDPDDFPDCEWPDDYEPTPEVSAELTCRACGYCTGTAWGGDADEAVQKAVRWWSGQAE